MSRRPDTRVALALDMARLLEEGVERYDIHDFTMDGGVLMPDGWEVRARDLLRRARKLGVLPEGK